MDPSPDTTNIPRVGKSTKAKRHAYWQDVIQAQRLSGLKIKDYCQEHHLSFDDFRRWRYRLNRQQRLETAVPVMAEKIDFKPIMINDPPVNGSLIRLEIEASKVSILLEPTVDELLLTKLLRIIGDYHARSTR